VTQAASLGGKLTVSMKYRVTWMDHVTWTDRATGDAGEAKRFCRLRTIPPVHDRMGGERSHGANWLTGNEWIYVERMADGSVECLWLSREIVGDGHPLLAKSILHVKSVGNG
jgi:hypothetical protein